MKSLFEFFDCFFTSTRCEISVTQIQVMLGRRKWAKTYGFFGQFNRLFRFSNPPQRHSQPNIR